MPVQTGHFVDIKLQTRESVRDGAQVEAVFEAFNPLHDLCLPSAPLKPIVVLREAGRPRPQQDAMHENGFAVAVGNIRTEDGFFDVTFSLVVNNEVRGAWGAALLNLELYEMYTKGRSMMKLAAKEV